jgi:hypothetical protein
MRLLEHPLKLGQADIDGEAGDDSGYSVAMSADGKRVIIGYSNNVGTNGFNSGHAGSLIC